MAASKELTIEPKGPLFHYTTAVGLHGIVNSGELWASHLSYTNDTAEMKYGMDLLSEVLKQETRSFPKDWKDILRELVPMAVSRGGDVPHAYAFSLSEEGEKGPMNGFDLIKDSF